MSQRRDTPTDSAPRLSRRSFLGTAAAGAAIPTLSALLAACEGGSSGVAGGGSERAKTVVFDAHVGRVQAPKLWNPMVPGFTNNVGFHQAMAEPLFILNYESGEVEPWLGTSFVANDALDLWTLKIQDGIKWADGEAYDADDIVFTIQLLLDGSEELTNAVSMQDWVKQVTKIDPLTVEFQLTKPNPRFQLDYFSVKLHNSVVILPQHVWEGQDPVKFQNYDPDQGWPLFTGPYKLTSVSPTKFTYERLDDWWGAAANFKPLPKPEKLEFVVSETEEVRVARAAEHGLDSIADLTVGAFESLVSQNDKIISWLPDKPYAWPDPCTRLLSLNNAIEPWSDRDMRWALNFALDRDEIVKIAYEGSTTPAKFFFPPYPALQEYEQLLDDEGVFDEYPMLKHDPDEASRILESKGYTKSGQYYEKDGNELRLQIDAPTDFVEIWRYADIIGEQLQRFGINAAVRKLAIGTWGEGIGDGKFEAATDWAACGSVSEPWGSMQVFHPRWVVKVGENAPSNAARWKNDEYGRYVDEIGQLPLGDPQVKTAFVKAARLWFHDLPFLPIAYARKLYAFDTTYWTGWATKENNYLQPTLDWANAHKIIHELRPAGDA